MSERGEVICTACGATNPGSAPVCRTCGRALPGLADRLFTTDSPAPSTGSNPSTPPAHRATAGELFTAATGPGPAAPTPAPAPDAGPPPTPPPVLPPAADPPDLPDSPDSPDSPAAWTGAGPEPAHDALADRPPRRTPLLVGAIIVVIVVATVAYLLLSDDDSTPTTATSAPSTATTVAPTTSSIVTTPPSQPTNLAVSAAGPTSLQMTWIDIADNEDRYLVARVRGDVFDEVADLPANSAGYVVDGLEPGTLYCLTVASTNAAVTGQPDYVEEACAVTAP